MDIFVIAHESEEYGSDPEDARIFREEMEVFRELHTVPAVAMLYKLLLDQTVLGAFCGSVL